MNKLKPIALACCGAVINLFGVKIIDRKKIIVIGAGPAGCVAAYRLQQQGYEVEVLEKNDQAGGRTITQEFSDFSLDTGAIFLMSSYGRTHSLLREFDLDKSLVPWKASTLLAENGSRYPVRYDKPISNLRLSPVSFVEKLRLLKQTIKEVFSSPVDTFDGDQLATLDNGENLESWSRRNLGETAYRYIVKPNHDMLYAVPGSDLSPAFQRAAMKKSFPFSLDVPREGLGSICSAIADKLDISYGADVQAIDIIESGVNVEVVKDGNPELLVADGLVVATDAITASKLLEGSVKEHITSALKKVTYVEYAHVAFAYQKNPWPELKDHMIVPVGDDCQNTPINAIVAHSRRRPGSAPAGGLVLGFYFNASYLNDHDDPDLIKQARIAVENYLGSSPQPEIEKAFRYQFGLTIPVPGHYESLTDIRPAMPGNVKLAGDYFAQAGIEAAVQSGERAAEEMSLN